MNTANRKKMHRILAFTAVLVLLIIGVLCRNIWVSIGEEKKIFELLARSSKGEITEEFLKQVGAQPGVLAVSAFFELQVTIAVSGYEGSFTLRAVDESGYPLEVTQAQENLNVGNKIPLYLEEHVLDGLLDKNKHPLTNSEKERLMAECPGLLMDMVNDTGEKADRQGIAAAILAGNTGKIYVSLEEGRQMAEDFGMRPHYDGISIQVTGKSNLHRLKETLTQTGFSEEENTRFY